VYATREYHVLWIHDFRGQTESGAVDNIGYSMVADVYLPALIESVKRHDSTGRVPAYMIFLDEYYYEYRNGWLWMTMLDDPLRASVRLPCANAPRDAPSRQRPEALLAPVPASACLQRAAREMIRQFEANGSGGRTFETSRHRVALSFNHRRETAALPPGEADALLDWCEEPVRTPSTNHARLASFGRRYQSDRLPLARKDANLHLCNWHF